MNNKPSLIKSLLEGQTTPSIVPIVDESGEWYGREDTDVLENPLSVTEAWPDVIMSALEYCVKAGASGKAVVHLSDNGDAFLLTTSSPDKVRAWLSSRVSDGDEE